jgi:LmbE family N-acetylglucosaminyl deacetylase
VIAPFRTCTALFCLGACIQLRSAVPAKAPPLLPPDSRYKADLLLVVAHPDDDVVIGGYLARIALDEHKRIAVIYCTKGDGGGNAVGYEAGVSLGQMRTIEARRALASYGIENVWFLSGHDTPGQNVLWSLDSWNHGRALDEVVRLMRLTRPEVVMTWLPDYVVGENHDDHQAAGVLATEAFDMAGDPTKFPEQVSTPRNRVGMMNLTEGLHVWQPKKLYYASDAFENFGPYWHDKRELSPFRKNFLDGNGPSYPNTDVSPSRHKTYAVLTAEHQKYYLTQEADLGIDAFEKNDFAGFNYPTRLIFGKSLVGGSVTGDVFEGVTKKPATFAPVRGFQPRFHKGLSLELGGPWAFYREFWKAHNLENLAELIPVPEVAIRFGNALNIPLVIRNSTGVSAEVTVTAALPTGWSNRMSYAIYPLKPAESYPIQAAILAPGAGDQKWQEITWRAETAGRQIGAVTMRVYVSNEGALPQ